MSVVDSCESVMSILYMCLEAIQIEICAIKDHIVANFRKFHQMEKQLILTQRGTKTTSDSQTHAATEYKGEGFIVWKVANLWQETSIICDP